MASTHHDTRSQHNRRVTTGIYSLPIAEGTPSEAEAPASRPEPHCEVVARWCRSSTIVCVPSGFAVEFVMRVTIVVRHFLQQFRRRKGGKTKGDEDGRFMEGRWRHNKDAADCDRKQGRGCEDGSEMRVRALEERSPRESLEFGRHHQSWRGGTGDRLGTGDIGGEAARCA